MTSPRSARRLGGRERVKKKKWAANNSNFSFDQSFRCLSFEKALAKHSTGYGIGMDGSPVW